MKYLLLYNDWLYGGEIKLPFACNASQKVNHIVANTVLTMRKIYSEHTIFKEMRYIQAIMDMNAWYSQTSSRFYIG